MASRTSSPTRLARVLAAASLFAPCVAAEPAPPPAGGHVVVKNIGLHIGGGPNDAATKAPFKKAIERVFNAFVACHEKAETEQGTFGVDLLVPAKGGKAEVSAPRTGMRGEAFVECVVGVFASVDFTPPKRGATRLSYSLRFSVE